MLQPPQSPKLNQSGVSWGPVSSVTVTVAGFFIAQIFAALLFIGLSSLLGWDIQVASDEMQSKPWLILTFGLATYGSYIFIIRSFLHWTGHRLKEIGLVRSESRLETFAYVVGGFVIYFIATILVMAAVSALLPVVDLNQRQDLGIDKNLYGTDLIPVFITLVLIPPIVEEMATRGFLYTGLKKKLNIFWAGIITSVIFGAAHLEWGGEAPLLWAAAIDTFMLSWILIYIREKTGSIYGCIGLHMLKNSVAFLSLFVFRLA